MTGPAVSIRLQAKQLGYPKSRVTGPDGGQKGSWKGGYVNKYEVLEDLGGPGSVCCNDTIITIIISY